MDIKRLLAVDVFVLVVYAIAANPLFTGVPMHEWIGLGLFLVFAAHVVMHFDWLAEIFRGISRLRGIRLGKFVVDVLLVIVLAVCVVSGIMVSGTVLRAFGLYATGYYFWDPLHAVSAKMLLALLLVHVVLNWKVIAAVFGKRKADRE